METWLWHRSQTLQMKGTECPRSFKYVFLELKLSMLSCNAWDLLSCCSWQKSLTNRITWITPDGCVTHTKPGGLSLLWYKNLWRHRPQRVGIIVPWNGFYGKEEENINEGTSKVCCSLKDRMQIQPLTCHIHLQTTLPLLLKEGMQVLISSFYQIKQVSFVKGLIRRLSL